CAARGSRAPHRDSQRAGRVEARAGLARGRRRTGARLIGIGIPAETLAVFLDTARGRIDEALERYLPVPPECPEIVGQAMRYSLFAGGKRLRPILTLAAADAVARTDRAPASAAQVPAMDAALPAACA